MIQTMGFPDSLDSDQGAAGLFEVDRIPVADRCIIALAVVVPLDPERQIAQ